MVAHDRGDSVALVHAARCADGRSATRLEHLVLSNGNIFLPLSNLTRAQRQILSARSWSQVAAAVTPAILASGLGATTFTPPRGPGDPEFEALTATFAHGNGMKVLHETIQYLAERSKDEQGWLRALADAPFPVTVIWGLCDAVSPPRVASYVWNEYLMLKPGGNRPPARTEDPWVQATTGKCLRKIPAAGLRRSNTRVEHPPGARAPGAR
jgi:pimeloyl-ACP methyl ester carboxylesterase